jgi:hypothetical protein
MKLFVVVSNFSAAPKNAVKNQIHKIMQYFVLETPNAICVVYENHRGEYISVSDCTTVEVAMQQAEKLNQHKQKNKIPLQFGNRYLRPYMGR